MIEDGHGNLLTADVDALVNTVNTVGVMGKGIALQFKRAYPANFRAYRAACSRNELRIGEVWVFDSGVLGPRRFVLNFPTKRHWRNSSRLEDITAGLDSLVEVINQHDITSVAIPALGCGGLDWAQVRPLIEQACARMPQVRALVFAPEGAPEPTSMPIATPPPALTPSRALRVTDGRRTRYLRRVTGPLLAPGREAAAYVLDEHRVPRRHRRDVVEFRNLRLSALDPAAEAVHSCAR